MHTYEPDAPDEPFDIGEPVRLHIPDKDDFDHEKHGMVGIIVERHTDGAQNLPGEHHELHHYRYTVSLDDAGRFPARHDDLRPE